MRWFLAVLFIGWTATLASAQATKGKTPPKQLSSDAAKLAGKTFDEWVKEISNKDPSKSATAISAIPAFPATTAIKAVPYLLAEMKKHTAATPLDLSVRCQMCVTLAALFGAGEPIDAKWKTEAVALLRFNLRDTQAILKFRSLAALAALGPDARAAMPDIIGFMLRDPITYEVREAAATALGAIAHDPANGPSLDVLKSLYGLLNDRAFQVRMAAVHSLSLLGPSNPSDKDLVENYVNALLPIATKDPDAGLQIWARVAIIGATSDFSAGNIDPIAKHAISADPGVRVQAVQAIGTLGSKAKAKVPILIVCLNDPDLNVQATAIWALSRMESAAVNALPLLQKLVDDPKTPELIRRASKDTAEKIKGK